MKCYFRFLQIFFFKQFIHNERIAILGLLPVVFITGVAVSLTDPAKPKNPESHTEGGMVPDASKPFEPETVLLTWQRDPSTTMTVDWHVLHNQHHPLLHYRPDGKSDWNQKKGTQFGFPFADRLINRVELTNLRPDIRYEIRFGQDSRTYHFRTMPDKLDRPVRFLVGGDVNVGEQARMMTRQTAVFDPDFIVIGGDLAYANGNPAAYETWYRFFDIFHHKYLGTDNRLVPIIAAIGNHEIWNTRHTPPGLPLDYYETEYGLMPGDAPYFNALFAFPGVPEYGVLDFGDYMSWIVLDSGHRVPVEGEQSRWLEKVLNERKGRPFIYPVYHVPAYPSIRNFEGTTSKVVREHWVPLFEENGVRIAFENHDHVYKRTWPLRNNKISTEDGIVYMGDGAWGVNTRQLSSSPEWYMKRASSQRHVIIGTVDKNGHHFEVINEVGELIDSYPELLPGRELSEQYKARNPVDPLWEYWPVTHDDDLPSKPQYVAPQDSLVLVAFYHQTGGPNWNNNSGWLEQPVEDWHGITVWDGLINSIDFRQNNLSGSLPRELGQLSSVQRLILLNNPNLNGPVPEEIGQLRNLQRIRFQGNAFSGFLPASFGALDQLQDLILSNNNFSGPIPSSWSDMVMLNRLDLSGNRLTDHIPASLGELKLRLTDLNLAGNRLHGPIPPEIGELQFLISLDLSDNQLSGAIPMVLKEHSSFDAFRFEGNNLE